MNLVKEANDIKVKSDKDSQTRLLLNALVSNEIDSINKWIWLEKNDIELQEMSGIEIKTLVDAIKGMSHTQLGKVETYFQPVYRTIAKLHDARVYEVQGGVGYTEDDWKNSWPQFVSMYAKVMPTIQDIRQIRTNILLEMIKDKMLQKPALIRSYFKKECGYNKYQVEDIMSLYDDYKEDLVQDKLNFKDKNQNK